MKLTKYTGVTLLYFCENNQNLAVQKSFITKARTLRDLENNINQLKKQSDKNIKNNCCVYLGVKDVFEINGPLKQGAILGRSVLWSYKSIESSKKLLKPKSKFWINSQKKKTANQYIAEIVFLLSSPIKYNDRRTVICNVLVETPYRINIYQKAISVGKSQELKEKLFNVLLQYEAGLINNLTFVGVANIKYVYEKVAIGKCFEALSKNERSVLSAKKLVFPIKKFGNYKF